MFSQAHTWISGTIGPFSEQELAKAVSGDGETTGLGRAKLLRSQLGISFSSCLMTMVSMTKKRSHGNHSVCSWVMKGARSKCRIMEIPPMVTRSKLLQEMECKVSVSNILKENTIEGEKQSPSRPQKYHHPHFTNTESTAWRSFCWVRASSRGRRTNLASFCVVPLWIKTSLSLFFSDKCLSLLLVF